MKVYSFNENIHFDNGKVDTRLICNTAYSKEIRIILPKGSVMKEHKAPYPIIVHLVKGEVDFGVDSDIKQMKEGDLISLAENVPHDLKASVDSVIRLSLSKFDTTNRVEKAVHG